MPKKGHGGKRQGAGRKPSGRTRRVGPFMLSPEAAEWLNTQVNKSEAVDKLILEKIQSQQKQSCLHADLYDAN